MNDQLEINKLKEQVSWYQSKLDELNQVFYQEGFLIKVARKLTRIISRISKK